MSSKKNIVCLLIILLLSDNVVFGLNSKRSAKCEETWSDWGIKQGVSYAANAAGFFLGGPWCGVIGL